MTIAAGTNSERTKSPHLLAREEWAKFTEHVIPNLVAT
jgi:hypothetical protein